MVVVAGGNLLVFVEERERITGGEDMSEISLVARAGSPKLLTGSRKDPMPSPGGFKEKELSDSNGDGIKTGDGKEKLKGARETGEGEGVVWMEKEPLKLVKVIS